MTQANKVLKVAQGELGYKEGRNNYSKYGEWYGEAGYSTAAWCAMFVSYCFSKAGYPLPAIQHAKGFAYCPYGVSYFKRIGKLYQYPRRGDIVFFDWGKDGISDHVGLVLEVHNNNTIKTIEGNTSIRNQSNGGMVMIRRRHRSVCCGFARPKGNESRDAVELDRYLKLSSPMMCGEDVKKIQFQLRKLGYSIKIDGYFGSQTNRVVRMFQKDRDLEVDGIIGSITWAEIFKK